MTPAKSKLSEPANIWVCEPVDENRCERIKSQELRELYAYWATLGRGSAIPLKSEFRPSAIPRVLPLVMMVDLIDAGRGYKVRLVGSKIRALLPSDTTGKTFFDDDPLLARRRMCDALQNVVRDRQPQHTEVTASNLPGMDIYGMEGLGLPLSRDGTTIDLALVGIVFKLRDERI